MSKAGQKQAEAKAGEKQDDAQLLIPSEKPQVEKNGEKQGVAPDSSGIEAVNKYIIHLEDASGNSLGSLLHETELDNEAVRAWFESEEPLGLVLNNQFTGGKDMNLDGFAKPLRVINIEKL